MIMKCSIITAVRNRADYIERALKSVQNQTYQNKQHIVIDGLSNDGTVDLILKSLKSKDIFISEKDSGIYDALNKGIGLATGEVIGFLHSDDIYSNNHVLERVMAEFQDNQVDIVYGDVAFFTRENLLYDVRIYKSKTFSKKNLSWGWMPPHPAIFMRRSVYKRFGFFKTRYKIAADYEYLCRIASQEIPINKYLPEILVRMQVGGISTAGFRSTWLLNQEVVQACRENGISTNLIKVGTKYPMKLLEKWNRKNIYNEF